MRFAVRCSVLQCVAVCCSVLQCVAVCCRVHVVCVRMSDSERQGESASVYDLQINLARQQECVSVL